MSERPDQNEAASSDPTTPEAAPVEPAEVTIIDAVGTAGGASDVVAVSDFRINLTLQHLYAAAYFSRQVARLEDEHAGEGVGDFFFGELFHHAIACLFSAAAGLEAYTNEIFTATERLLPNHDPLVLAQLWRLINKRSVTEKLDSILELRGKPKIDKNDDYWKNYILVVTMRDAMIHYKPASNSEKSKHFEISQLLSGKFDLSSFTPEHRAFPLGWATHGGTKWIVSSVLKLIREFERLADLPLGPYGGAEDRLRP